MTVHACSSAALNFQLPNEEKHNRRVRTMDFFIPLATHVIPFNKDEPFNTFAPGEAKEEGEDRYYLNGEEVLICDTIYGFLGLGALGNRNIIDGLNGAGFSMGGNTLFNTEYQNPTEGSGRFLSAADIVRYCLATCATVADVEPALKKLCAWRSTLDDIESVALPLLHYAVADAEGNHAVVEYQDGKLHVYDKHHPTYPSIGILTNDPKYPSQLDGFKGSASFNTNFPGTIQLNGVMLLTDSIGSGSDSIPGGCGSAARFTRAGTLTRFIPKTVRNIYDVNAAAQQVLQSLWAPRGMETFSMGSKVVQNYTRWGVVIQLEGDYKGSFATTTHWSSGTDTPKKIFNLSDYNFDVGTKHTPKLISPFVEETEEWKADYANHLAKMQ